MVGRGCRASQRGGGVIRIEGKMLHPPKSCADNLEECPIFTSMLERSKCSLDNWPKFWLKKLKREATKNLGYVAVDLHVLIRYAIWTYNLLFYLNADERRETDTHWREPTPLSRCRWCET